MKRLVMGAFALTLAIGFSGAAEAQVICQKTSKSGKVKYKLRTECKSSEVVAQDFMGFVPGDVVTTGDLPGAPGDLLTTADLPSDLVTESDLPAAPGLLATNASVAAAVAGVPRTRVYSYDSGPEFVSLDTTFAPVPINGTETSVDVTTTAASTDLVVTFSAECQGPDDGGNWVDVDVKVDGVTLAPTSQLDDAFCEGTYEMHSVTVVAHDLAPGVHPVTVEALETVADGSWLDDIGITILAIED